MALGALVCLLVGHLIRAASVSTTDYRGRAGRRALALSVAVLSTGVALGRHAAVPAGPVGGVLQSRSRPQLRDGGRLTLDTSKREFEMNLTTAAREDCAGRYERAAFCGTKRTSV